MGLPAVTLQRVENVLKKEELEYSVENHEVLTGFVNAIFGYRIIEELELLYISGIWRAETTDAALSQRLLQLVREKNADIYMPKLIASADDAGVSRIAFEYSIPIGGGMTDEQLHEVIVALFATTLGVFNDIEGEFPQLVTWNTEED